MSSLVTCAYICVRALTHVTKLQSYYFLANYRRFLGIKMNEMLKKLKKTFVINKKRTTFAVALTAMSRLRGVAQSG